MNIENGIVGRKIIDAHTHIGLDCFQKRENLEEIANIPAARDKFENRIEDFVVRMNQNGIDKSIVFPFPAPGVDIDAANRYILDSYQQYPNQIIPFVLLDENIEYWLKLGVRGFKYHSGLMPIPDISLRHYCQVISEAKVPLMSHISLRHASFSTQIDSILEVAPDMTLLIAHMGRRVPNTGIGVEENLQKVREMENVYFETSTVRDVPVLKKAIELLGADRVIFGSDYPFNSSIDNGNPQKKELDFILQARLPIAQEKMVLVENIEKCLNVKV